MLRLPPVRRTLAIPSRRRASAVLVIAACAAATAVAAWLVRRYSPHASGSGIPHVEASPLTRSSYHARQAHSAAADPALGVPHIDTAG